MNTIAPLKLVKHLGARDLEVFVDGSYGAESDRILYTQYASELTNVSVVFKQW